MRSLAIVTLALSLVACRDAGPPASHGVVIADSDAERVLQTTPWLDSMPESERHVIQAYVFQRGEGIFFHGNSYKATIEALRYWVEGGTIKLNFLDEQKTYKTKWKIERYRGEVFDYKLTIEKDPRGPKVYYGFDQNRQLPAWVSKIKALPEAP